VHKHVVLIALLAALERKNKAFLFVDTHAGGGSHTLDPTQRLNDPIAATEALLERARSSAEPEIASYGQQVLALRALAGNPRLYPGSPLLAASQLRAIDRGVCFEQDPVEATRLGKMLPRGVRMRAERADGFERIRAVLPPPERRALLLIDPPYESESDYERIGLCLAEALKRLASAVIAVWYPIKDARDSEAWLASLLPRLPAPACILELWIHARDSRICLNGSGLLLVNPPYLTDERARMWQPALLAMMHHDKLSGSRVEVYAR